MTRAEVRLIAVPIVGGLLGFCAIYTGHRVGLWLVRKV